MKKIFVKYHTTGKIYQLTSKETFRPGEKLLVEGSQGLEIAVVCELTEEMRAVERSKDKILRRLTEEDKEKLKALQKKAEEALSWCQKKAQELKLPMKIVKAEYSLDEKKLTFYFISANRIDFRELLSHLIANFHKNIRLQQLGARDAAKFIQGVGPCGRPYCCQTFLEPVDSITLEMAKEQDLTTVNPAKISGSCGKLMCCLAFEVDVYRKLQKQLPKIGETILTKQGKGTVVGRNILKQTVSVQLEDGNQIEEKIYLKEE